MYSYFTYIFCFQNEDGYHVAPTNKAQRQCYTVVTVSHIMCYLCLYVATACYAHVCLHVETTGQLAAAASTSFILPYNKPLPFLSFVCSPVCSDIPIATYIHTHHTHTIAS